AAEFFSDEAAEVIGSLLGSGEAKEALTVTSLLLAVLPDPRLEEKRNREESPFRPTLKPVGRVSDWEYGALVGKLLEPIVRSTGRAGVRLCARLLDDVVRLSAWDEHAEDSDRLSYMWRPAIEDHVQNTDRGLAGTL